jgi:hypothetical protein
MKTLLTRTRTIKGPIAVLTISVASLVITCLPCQPAWALGGTITSRGIAMPVLSLPDEPLIATDPMMEALYEALFNASITTRGACMELCATDAVQLCPHMGDPAACLGEADRCAARCMKMFKR